MGFGYRPAFDVSTVSIANDTLKRLQPTIIPEDEEVNRMEVLKMLNYLETQADDGLNWTLYKTLDPFMGKLFEKNRRDFFKYENFIKVEEVIRLLFGISCLEKIIEAICLAEEIIYIGGHAYNSFKFAYSGSLFDQFDNEQKERIWKTLIPSEETQVEYANWVKETGILAYKNNSADLIREVSLKYLSYPIVDLIGHLLRYSNGQIEPMNLDSQDHFDSSIKRVSEEELRKIILLSPFNETDIDLRKISRAHYYLINSLFYERICRTHKVEYTCNDLRNPFLFTVKQINFASPDKQKIIDTISKVIGLKYNLDKKSVSIEDVVSSDIIKFPNILLSVVLNNAKDSLDIIPSAYRVRKILEPVRTYIKEHGVTDPIFDTEISLLTEKMIKKHKFNRDAKEIVMFGFKVTVPSEFFSWMYNIRLQEKEFVTSVRVLSSQYSKYHHLSNRLIYLFEETYFREEYKTLRK